MKWKSLDEYKCHLKAEGFLHRAILDEREETHLAKMLESRGKVIDTPPDELRFIEGLLNLPFGHLKDFKVIPAEENARCRCGRTPNALDIIAYASRRNIHGRSQMRDALLGLVRVFEIAADGREGDCMQCGRGIVMFSYWTNGYMYA